MASGEEDLINDWKKLWQLVSGIHYETPKETVKQKLLDVSKELQEGILQFKKCSTTSADLEMFLKQKSQEKLFPFTNKLQSLLDLDSEQCWEILCYYLVNEYRGSANSLINFISTEANMTKLLDDIWGYYSLERIIVLKIVKNILEFHNSPGHPYQEEYKFILEKLTLKKIKESYIKQLEYLVKESPPSKLAAGEFFGYQAKLVSWSERNSKEISETLHILMLIVYHDSISVNELGRLLNCFKTHAFGKQQRFLDSNNDFHSELMTKISYSEVILFLLCLDFTEKSEDAGWISDVVSSYEKDIVLLHHNEEHGPILLAWMLLNFRRINVIEDVDAVRKYRQFGVKAVQLNVFKYLKELISHRMLKDESMMAQISRLSIYNHISHLCDLFDGDGTVGQHPFIYELLCELISWPAIANKFCEEETGVRSLYNTTLENFPVDFNHLSMIARSLCIAGKGDYIKKQLENLPIYTELFDESKFSLKASLETDDGFILLHDYAPFRRIDYTIPAQTSAVAMCKSGQTYIHFRTDLNYFNVLHNEVNLLLTEAIQCSALDMNRLNRVNLGMKYLACAISKMKSPTEISQEMVHPTEMSIDILNKMKNLPNPPIELLANCLNVSAALLPLFENEVLPRVINLNILPKITNETLDFKKYAYGICFDSGLVGFYLINIEKKIEKYEFLLAYLNFLRAYAKLEMSRLFDMEIPGLVFLLREVFPHIHSWRFQSIAERNKIYAEIMRFICEVLDILSAKKTVDRIKLRNICVYSLLNLDNGLVLLKFIAIGNPFLQASMENESNWIVSSSQTTIFLVRFSMRILMQLLRLRTTVYDSSTLSPIEALIYTMPKQRDTLRIIPVVTSYMNNIFDRWLPILSCRLLRRIALEYKMSLLACLDMEPDQIRLTFLQKLPDELESDDLKISILEFVEACIEKQPGLTEALFKMNYEKEKKLFFKGKSSDIGDSVLMFMQDYLEAVKKYPETVEAPLPTRIMNIFHALWKNNMQSLAHELMEKESFWPSLCNPLFHQFKSNVKAYGQLFNIMGIELFCYNANIKFNVELKKVITKFFEESYFEKWLEQVFNLPKKPVDVTILEDIPEWLSRLQSFKDFIIILLKKKVKGIDVPNKKMKIFAEKTLNSLVERSEYTEDLRPFIVIAELFLIIILNFKHSYTDNEKEDEIMLSHIIKLLGNIAVCYEDLHTRAKESCLAIAIKVCEMLTAELTRDTRVTSSFLNPIVDIICWELNTLEKCVKTEIKSSKHETNFNKNSLILSLNLLKTAAVPFHNEGPANWDLPFLSNRVYNRLLSCISWIVQLSSKHKISVELLDVLIVFAKGNCSEELLYCDIDGYLWLKLLPPKELLQTPYVLQQQKGNSWTMQNWWPIYSRGIEVVTILLEKHTHRFLKEAIMFVGIHEEYLMDSLLLAKQSLEPTAMVLIKNAAKLISELVTYEKQWRLEHTQSLYNLMRCVQMLMDHSISLLYRPKILKRLIDGLNNPVDTFLDTSNAYFADDIVTSMNDLVEVIVLCAKCLLRFSPSLLDLICEPEFLVAKWEPLIEIQFGAPKLDAGNYQQLTFGTVLSAVGIFSKALNLQGYSFHEIPLNELPHRPNKNGKDSPASAPKDSSALERITPINAASTSASRVPFSKSMSVASATSMSSTSAPSNELLSSLDGELCLLALEKILTLLASQSLLALKNTNLSNREKQLIRREISTELIVYHEFVRKKVLFDYKDHKSIYQRKDHGSVMMMELSDEVQPSSKEVEKRRGSDHRHSMRVNVVRRLHLQQQQKSSDRASFETSQLASPSASSQRRSDLNLPAAASTPNTLRPVVRKALDDGEAVKKLCAEDEEVFFEPEEPKYSPLSYVQLVEEDYLHFLSILFTVICQSD